MKSSHADHSFIRKKILLSLLLASLLTLFCSLYAAAGVVKASGRKDGTDYSRIVAELKKTKYVRLQSGNSYYLSGTIYMQSGWTIDATGATVTCASSPARNYPKCKGYASIRNVKIKGGTWLYKNKSGFAATSFQFSHGTGITFEGMTIKCANYRGHAIELIACADVDIKNCKIYAQGTCPSGCHEEMIQIDIAAPSCNKNGVYNDGRCCHRVTITGCTVVGARGIATNYAKKDGGSWLNHYYSGIVIRNSNITGMSGEAVALFNTISGEVSGCTIVNKLGQRDTSSAYTIGLHCALFGVLKTGNIVIRNNVIRGGRSALQFYSHTKARYGTVTISGCKLYCRKGKASALAAYCINRLNKSGVYQYAW